MTRKYIEGMLFMLGNIETKNMTVGEQMLSALAYNALIELLSKLQKEETK